MLGLVDLAAEVVLPKLPVHTLQIVGWIDIACGGCMRKDDAVDVVNMAPYRALKIRRSAIYSHLQLNALADVSLRVGVRIKSDVHSRQA